MSQNPGSNCPSRRVASFSESKFHGQIEIKWVPEKVPPIKDGAKVMVVLRSIRFGNLPDFGGESEVCLTVSAETDKNEKDAAPVGSLKVECIKYVADNSALNIRDLVILRGAVHGHLTLRCSIDELDAKAAERTSGLLAALVRLAGAAAPGPITSPILGALPSLLGALFAFDQDDQIFVLNHSFYTENINVDDSRRLRAGMCTFTKGGDPRSEQMEAQVTLQIEVIPYG